MGLPLSELRGMSLREFQYYMDGYVEREQNAQRIKAFQSARLAIMIGATIKTKKAISINYLMNHFTPFSTFQNQEHNMSAPVENPITNDKFMPLEEIKTMIRNKMPGAREKYKEYVESIKRNFQVVRDSPTYKKSTISKDEIQW